jgi:hypothetical protein
MCTSGIPHAVRHAVRHGFGYGKWLELAVFVVVGIVALVAFYRAGSRNV